MWRVIPRQTSCATISNPFQFTGKFYDLSFSLSPTGSPPLKRTLLPNGLSSLWVGVLSGCGGNDGAVIFLRSLGRVSLIKDLTLTSR